MRGLILFVLEKLEVALFKAFRVSFGRWSNISEEDALNSKEIILKTTEDVAHPINFRSCHTCRMPYCQIFSYSPV